MARWQPVKAINANDKPEQFKSCSIELLLLARSIGMEPVSTAAFHETCGERPLAPGHFWYLQCGRYSEIQRSAFHLLSPANGAPLHKEFQSTCPEQHCSGYAPTVQATQSRWELAIHISKTCAVLAIACLCADQRMIRLCTPSIATTAS